MKSWVQKKILICVVGITGCGGIQKSNISSDPIQLVRSDGTSISLPETIGRHTYTVMEFFSAECPCQSEHDAYLNDLQRRFAGKRIQFIAIDSTRNANLQYARAQAAKRNYQFPIWIDPEGRLAKKVGAQFATHTVVWDNQGNIHYQGGIDSSRTHLATERERYLENALTALSRGKRPLVARGKTLGCTLDL